MFGDMGLYSFIPGIYSVFGLQTGDLNLKRQGKYRPPGRRPAALGFRLWSQTCCGSCADYVTAYV